MKKWATFVLCAVLITGLITRTIHLVSAQEETQTEETQAEKTQAEESSPQDSTEPDEEAGEYPEESHNDGEEQETEQPEQSESESPETSEESESDPSQSPPDESDSEGENLPAAETDESGEIQTEEETPEVIEGEIPKEIPGGIPNGIPSHKESESNQDVVEAMQAAQDSLNEHIDYIAGLLDMTDGYDLIEGEDNFCEALAIYAIRHEQTENYPYEIEITGEEDFTQLQSIYWSLNAVNGAKTEGNSVIRVTQLSAVKVYNLSESQRDLFKNLNSKENRDKVSGLFPD